MTALLSILRFSIEMYSDHAPSCMSMFFNPLTHNFHLTGLKRMHTNHKCQKTDFVHMPLYKLLQYNMKTKRPTENYIYSRRQKKVYVA